MALLRTFYKNFGHPQGFWGRVVAFRLDISNRQANEWTLSLLDLQPADCVLEVGFGSGRTLLQATERVPRGTVTGVDSSPTMLELALKRNARWIAAGRMKLTLGCMEALDFPADHFNKIYTVQVINYLPDPLAGIKEMHRVVKPGGRLAIFFEGKEKFEKIHAWIEGIYHPYDAREVVELMYQAGFSHSWFEAREFVVRKVRYTGLVALGEKGW